MRILKETAYWFFILSGVTWIAGRLNRRKSLVLLYHGVDAGAPNPVLNFDGMHVRVTRFERQMRYLAKHYRAVTLDQLLDGAPDAGRGKPLAAITFDDGYGNLYRYAYPVLKRLGLPATVFIIADYLQSGRARWWDRLRTLVASTRCSVVRTSVHGTERLLRLITVTDKQTALRTMARELQCLPPQRRETALARLAEDLGVDVRTLRTPRPLSKRQIREMLADGISVGGHGRSHDSFLHLNRERLLAELSESKQALESLTGRPVWWLAYPYGDFSPEAVDVAIEAGYRGALTTIEGLNDGIPDPFTVRRMAVDDTMTLAHFIVAASGLRDWLKGILRVCRIWKVPFVSVLSGGLERRPETYVRHRGEV